MELLASTRLVSGLLELLAAYILHRTRMIKAKKTRLSEESLSKQSLVDYFEAGLNNVILDRTHEDKELDRIEKRRPTSNVTRYEYLAWIVMVLSFLFFLFSFFEPAGADL
jgi:hypothetical protein